MSGNDDTPTAEDLSWMTGLWSNPLKELRERGLVASRDEWAGSHYESEHRSSGGRER